MSLLIYYLPLMAVCNGFVLGEYPGRRHHQIVSPDEKHYLIEQLSNFIDQQARRRFQQQIHKHHQKPQHPAEITGNGFSFLLPPAIVKGDFQAESDAPIQFAVPPFDSRYYQENIATHDYDEENQESLTDTEDSDQTLLNDNVEQISITEGNKNKILIPSPMHVHESERISLQPIGKEANKQPDVMQKPLQSEFDNTMSLYIVALIAGLSCAFSTGLIAIGLMYWTLYKKSKSDACDYPYDYGIIGPRPKNPDNSQISVDNKLASSATMFHYQHQKQQLIAMETRNGAGDNDDENDSDDNENDFTVYECPGLAEVQGMEVTNPIFNQCETSASKTTEKSQSTSSTKTANQK